MKSATVRRITMAMAVFSGLQLPKVDAQTLGTEVHRVQAHSPAAEINLAAGDRLTGWREDEKAGAAAMLAPIAGPIDALLLELDRADLEPVTLTGSSTDRAQRWTLPQGRWGMALRPIARTGGESDSIDRALRHLDAGLPEKTCASLATLSKQWAASGRDADALWAQWTCLSAWLAARNNEAATQQAEIVLSLADRSLDTWRRALFALLLADASIDAEHWTLAQSALDRAGPAIAADDEILRARLEMSRGQAELRRGQGASANARFTAALDLLEPQGRDSLRWAAASCELAFSRMQQAQTAQAIDAAREGLATALRLSPGGMHAARCRANLGLALNLRGELLEAQEQIAAAIAIYDRLVPDTTRVASALNALSTVQANLGDVIGQEHSIRRALSINERLRPGSSSVAVSLQNLAQVSRLRGNLDEARQLARRAQDIYLRLTPRSPNVAFNHHLLGLIAQRRGDMDEAAAQFAASASLMEQIAPLSVHHAWALNSQGDLALERRDFQAALSHYEKALAIRLQNDASLEERAVSWTNVGLARLALKHWEAAGEAIDDGIALFESTGLAVVEYAAALNARGKLSARRNDRQAALRAYCASADVIDRFRERVSNEPEVQAQATARYARFQNDCVIARIEAGDPVGALETLERSRARALSMLLGRRSLPDHPALPLELKREWLSLDAQRAAARSLLLAADHESTHAARAESQTQNAVLDRKLDELILRIRNASPQVAQLFYPAPVTFAQLKRQIAADGAMVHFVVGDERSFALVTRAGSTVPAVRNIDLRREALDAEVSVLRAALLQRRPDRDALLGAWHARLIAPLLDELGKVDRLTVIPEGALFQLPFAALKDEAGRFVVERFAVSIVDSATVWARLANEHKAVESSTQLLAVAMPDVSPAHAHLQPAGFASIPGALSEAAAITGKRPGARLLHGSAATESAVQAAALGAKHVHFAVHGIFNPLAPLESGLLLEPDPSRRGAAADGFLQAWEVLRGWRTSARIVTLSSCDTGRGGLLAGEGSIGLTRAFQYAGAGNVVASLWEAPDRSTARLMTRFYEGLDGGLPPDRALQAAQIAMLGESRSNGLDLLTRGVGAVASARRASDAANDPLNWAAFEVFGSGR